MKSKRFAVLALTVAMAAFAGCHANDATDSPSAPDAGSTSANAAPSYDPSTATARVFGSIQFEGTPPVMQPVHPGGSRFCVLNARGLLEEEVQVTKDSKLRNVIVYVRSGFEGRSYNAPGDAVVLDQRRCEYIPHVFTLMAKQKLLVRNSDDTFHNVHAVTQVNAGVNLAQPTKDQENTVSFEHAEMPFHIGCDLHKWMGAWVGVFEHPFHTTSGASGDFELKLPPGKYEVVAWHERYGEKIQSVDVVDKAQMKLNFSFAEKDKRG